MASAALLSARLRLPMSFARSLFQSERETAASPRLRTPKKAYSIVSLTIPRRCRSAKIAGPFPPHATASPANVNDWQAKPAVRTIAG
jgi:hypothetical protein